ncbi:mechanosensitive ion channel [bacterium]|nr:mechanosensitive ion channel [bacterium]
MDRFVKDIKQWWVDVFGLSPEVLEKVVFSLLVIIAVMLLRAVILLLVRKRTVEPKTRYQWRKTSSHVATFLILLLLARTWIRGFESISTFLGLFSAGIAIAMKDVIMNFIGWMFIAWRKPFKVGDRIEVDDTIGDVVDIRLFQFTVLEVGNWVDADQSTGRIIHIPNSRVFTNTQANYNTGFQYIWHELPVRVTFESNWRDAEEILRDIASRHAQHLEAEAHRQVQKASSRYMIHYQNLSPTVYVSVREWGVLLTIRYLTAPRRRRGTEEAIWKDVLDQFSLRPDISFAYPTTRLVNMPGDTLRQSVHLRRDEEHPNP